MIGRRRPEEAWTWFATVALHPVLGEGRPGMVGAHVPGVERRTARLVNQAVDVGMDSGDVVERRAPARHHRLVGDGDQGEALLTEASQSVGRVALKPYLIRCRKQVDILNQHPVPIEEDCRS